VAGIAVCNVPDYGTEEVADHSITLALALLRNILHYSEQTRKGGWDWKAGEGKLRRLSELTFGIIGLGRIGTAVALRAKAFGFRVLFYDPYLSRGVEKSLGIKRADRLDDLLKISDVVSLHCPLTDETRGFIDHREFDAMKEGVYLVNTARAGIVEVSALKKFMKNKKVAGAGFDVAPSEPPADEEFETLENLILTPHAAFYSVESFIECRRSSALVVRKYFDEKKILNLVNREYLE
jgi:phosphoglycerate dehydrogenase-like enzyme